MSIFKQKLPTIIITLAILISLFFRFYKLGQVPPGLNRDGASIGYTAYSIFKTGNDEYNQSLPLSIKSFGDWKLPLYVYLTIPAVFLFGLNETTVYLVTVLAGLINLIFIYLLAKQIFPKKREKFIPFLSLIILAFLPWHLHFSRYNHEGNLGLTLITAAVYFFFQGLKKPKFLLLSSFLFSLTLYTYHAYLFFTPLLVAGLGLLFMKELKKRKALVLTASLLFLAFFLLIVKTTFSGNQQKSSISFLTDKNVIHQEIELPRQEEINPLKARLFYNKPVVFSRLFLERYFNSFSPNFLALKGGTHPNHDLPESANIFPWQYPFLLLGLLIFLKKKKNLSRKMKGKKLILIWLVLAPIVSSLTKDAPNSGRTSMMIIPLVLLVAAGLNFSYQFLKNQKLKILFCSIITFLFIFSILNFYQTYFLTFPVKQAKYWGAGYQKLVTFLNQEEYRDKEILIQKPTYSPYIYFLFYSKYDPKTYQQEVRRYQPDEEGFHHVKHFDRFTFRNFNLEDELNKDQLMVVWQETLTEKQKEKLKEYQLITISDYQQPIFTIFQGKL